MVGRIRLGYPTEGPRRFQEAQVSCIAVDEDAGRWAWRGNEKLDEDTSVFGTILIVDEPAVPQYPSAAGR